MNLKLINMKKTFLIPMSEQEAKQYCFGKDIEVGIVDSDVWKQADKTKAVDVWEYFEQSDLEVKLAAILLEGNSALLKELNGHYFMGGEATLYEWKSKQSLKYEIEFYDSFGDPVILYTERTNKVGSISNSLEITQEFLNKLNKL